MNVYVKSARGLSFRDQAPDYGKFISPMEARRMSPAMKNALAVSLSALDQAGLECPDAVITGTGFGSVASSEAFIRSLVGLSDAPMKPTHFMQSTHNTVGSMIAIKLGCRGYNATYSHRVFSFENALLDALMQISSGQICNALVGAFEEVTPEFSVMLSKLGFSCRAEDGTLSGTAVSMVLSGSPERALCELCDVALSRSSGGFIVPAGVEVVGRGEYTGIYGGNFSSSAYGALEAVYRIAGGVSDRVMVSNDCPGQGSSMVTFGRVCGN